MRLFKKENETVQVLCFPNEEVEKGDYLLIEEQNGGRSLLIQVIDIQFANLPGMMEDLLRDGMSNNQIYGEDIDPLNISSHITLLRDARLVI